MKYVYAITTFPKDQPVPIRYKGHTYRTVFGDEDAAKKEAKRLNAEPQDLGYRISMFLLGRDGSKPYRVVKYEVQ